MACFFSELLGEAREAENPWEKNLWGIRLENFVLRNLTDRLFLLKELLGESREAEVAPLAFLLELSPTASSNSAFAESWVVNDPRNNHGQLRQLLQFSRTAAPGKTVSILCQTTHIWQPASDASPQLRKDKDHFPCSQAWIVHTCQRIQPITE
ncbi:hypothetical protein BaRGS_00020987 [Batillaria attramentaria]|uniref:Uncharacterized protein n=1 Tax=Batillaria attramentaria TaxID=370345 RepID=A0ABD0KLL6_9CAEN